MTRTRFLPSSAALIVAALAFAAMPSEASAQTQWNGYAPTYAAQPAAAAPAAAVQPPVYYYPTNPSGWQGYAPATAWRYYDPAAGWRDYTPGTAAAPSAVAAAPARPIFRASNAGRPISSTNREFGTGRNVHMHKPWLPNSPR
ncbi:MAG: hypothetical protein P4L85_17115 [Paludisphaera borealis]|uniref:hypothetical protein n=1 Tax=Paludisphaera borealis TaxID=1387353 RepID=UPI002848ABB5|nr:hypothetical protein [Paludisphaera borealis]MDR3621075.1 hypothetical protein [Paludisphaera borealis]